MSALEPVEYQSAAIEKISSALNALASVEESKDRLIIFKSPTGSGKTLMVGSALAAAYDTPSERKFIVLWLTPGKGDLHKQSAKALSGILADTSLQVHLLDSQDDIVRYQDPTSGSVFVVNWEKLRTEKDGKWANKMLADGEKANFFTLLTAASAKGLDMIAVVDESHTNLAGEQTDKLMKAIRAMRPFIQLELSATPTAKPDPDLMSEGVHHWIRVKFEDVEAAGMVRKCVELNDHLSDVQVAHKKDSLQVQVLWAAWEKIEALTLGYAAARSSVKPLLLIQYPDGDKAAELAEIVEKFLAKRGLVKDATYAIWLSGDHSAGLESIASNSSAHRALIFKQAIATGWDCPRAQVLVQFRDPKSPIFQIQTLGRILRSPEQKHYADERLNLAYVFSDLEGVSVRIEIDEPDVQIRDTTVERGSVYPAGGLSLRSAFQPRTRSFHYPMVENLTPPLNKALDEMIGPFLTADPYTSTPVNVITDASVAMRDLDAGIIRQFKGGKATGDLDDVMVQSLYNALLVARIGAYLSRAQSLSRIKRIISLWFKKNRPGWAVEEIQHFALRHQSEFMEAIDQGCHVSRAAELAAAIAEARGTRRVSSNWEVPLADSVASKSYESALIGYLCRPPLVSVDRSLPEKYFEEYLEKQVESGVVKWWWKNGKQDEKFLGVEYLRPVVGEPDPVTRIVPTTVTHEERITYPDYLVYTNSETVWAVEVKGVEDKDGAPNGITHAKCKGLSEWVAKLNEQRKTDKALASRPSVCAAVVVPVELTPGFVTVKFGDPSNWHEPSASNLATDKGWAALNFSN